MSLDDSEILSGKLRTADIRGAISKVAALYYLGQGIEASDYGRSDIAIDRFYKAARLSGLAGGSYKNGLLFLAETMLEELGTGVGEIEMRELAEAEKLFLKDDERRMVDNTNTGSFVRTLVDTAYQRFMRDYPQEPEWEFDEEGNHSRLYILVAFVSDSLEVAGVEGLERMINPEDYED